MPHVTLITPTADRPLAFSFCERWMRRAIGRFNEPVQWIVADDGREPALCTLGQTHLLRPPADDPATSFRGNLAAALAAAAGERILFIEDDDWYAADHLAQLVADLDEAEIAGQARAKYYHVAARRHHRCRNRRHASLCQTGVRAALVPWLLDVLRDRPTTFVDVALWREGARGVRQKLRPASTTCVGIKGLPGRNGLGMGHRLDRRHAHDPQGEVLRDWIGPEDAAVYFDEIAAATGVGARGVPCLRVSG
ncbi:MAG: glycosyltransferase [Planctomycetales bacterium]